ncbi:3-hydroxybutyrate dehydrogenase [Microbacterium sp. USHLN186]|uniref:3-hydroxybutyrate dehydrogenase n=1 Tax=Microbacterium sp. USHLN186 TaxID=3081286 RepID=UPI003016BA28
MSGGSLSARRALVTGGASGIGAAIATALAARGAHVTVVDRDAEAAEQVATTVSGSAIAVDLLAPDALSHPDLVHALERTDILVNNAGVQHISPIEDFDPAQFRRMLTLMLEVPFLLIRAALPGMYRREYGRVVNVSSVHGLRASPFKSAYVAAKHGLEGLSKATALEGGAHGVTSNCVNPGYVRTPLVEHQVAEQARVHGIAEHEVLAEVMLTESAIKRLVEPDEVASLVAWLASDEAAMVTGASYTMDGGWSAR